MKSPLRNWSLRNRLTVGVLVLSAFGFIGAGFTAQFSLKSYLIGQIDEQLNSVIGGTTNRVSAAGIVNDEETITAIIINTHKPSDLVDCVRFSIS